MVTVTTLIVCVMRVILYSRDFVRIYALVNYSYCLSIFVGIVLFTYSCRLWM